MSIYLGTANQTLTNLVSNGSLASNTTGWTIDSRNTVTQYNKYIGLQITTAISSGSFSNYQDLSSSVSGSTASTKQILYFQQEVCNKPTSTNSPGGWLKGQKNGSSTDSYYSASNINILSNPVCNFSSINMGTLPSGGYAYATINSGTTHYTNGSIPIEYGDIVHIYIERTSGNAGVYLYHDKSTPDEMPDYHEYSSALTYNWDTSTVPYCFNNAYIIFENDDTGYLNCTIKIDMAWYKQSIYLETFDGTDYYSYDRALFSIKPSTVLNDIGFFKNIIVVNLTTEFGRGNEPTKEQCDSNIFMNSNGNVIYTGSSSIAGTATVIKKIYVGINGVAREVKKAYIGVGGIAQQFYSGLPTFNELFATIDTFDRWGQNGTSTTTYPGSTSSTYPEPDSTLPQPSVGDIWYLFYAVGNSLEISKLELLTSTTMSKTTLRSVTTGTQYAAVLNSDSTGIYGSTATAASNSIYMHFTTPSYKIDEMFRTGNITILKGYHSTSTTNTTANLGIASSTTFSNGVLFPIFSNLSSTSTSATKTTLWGAVNATSPTSNVIKGGTNATFLTNTPLLLTSSSYYMPARSSSNIIQYVRGYTLIYFQENW